MKSPKITNRMKVFVDQALPGYDFWDLCCDHGYIGIHALLSEKFPVVHFVDQKSHIISKLKSYIENSPKTVDERSYKTYCLDLRSSKAPYSGNVLIAGVGGELLFRILKNAKDRSMLLHCKRLLLSPHTEVDKTIELLENELEGHFFLNSKLEIQEGNRKRYLIIMEAKT